MSVRSKLRTAALVGTAVMLKHKAKKTTAKTMKAAGKTGLAIKKAVAKRAKNVEKTARKSGAAIKKAVAKKAAALHKKARKRGAALAKSATDGDVKRSLSRRSNEMRGEVERRAATMRKARRVRVKAVRGRLARVGESKPSTLKSIAVAAAAEALARSAEGAIASTRARRSASLEREIGALDQPEHRPPPETQGL